MLNRTLHKSFRSTRLVPYRHHARALLRSNMASLALLTLLFLYSNWCFQSLKQRVHAERAAAALGSAHSQGSGGVLFSWGLDANHRLGRTGGDAAVPEVALPQLEVVGIAASRHTLVVTSSGAVWSMGANDSSGGGGHGSAALTASGQLGRGGGWAAGQVLGPLQGVAVRKVAAGRYHSVAVAEDGRVFTWGLNDWGQLGRPAAAAAGVPAAPAAAATKQEAATYHKDVRLPLHKRALTAAGVAGAQGDAALPAHMDSAPATSLGGASGARTAAAAAEASAPGSGLTAGSSSGDSSGSSNGSSNGSPDSSSCTSGWSCHHGSPGLVAALQNVTVVDAKAGRYSTVALDAAGRLWVWGYDGCATAGQLPRQQDAWEPRLVQGQLHGQQVTAFDVGYTFWLAATKDGALFSCDTQDDGYAGTLPEKRKPNNAGQLGRSGPPHEPGRVLGALQDKAVVAVAAGREHALAVTADGQLYSFGGGRAVLGRPGDAGSPGLVTGSLGDQSVRMVAAGEYFSLAATDNMLYGWGSNAYLCTGTSTDKGAEVLQPTAVAGPLGARKWTVNALAAGYQHALALADQPGSPAAAKLLREAAAAAAVSSGSGSQPEAVEVVLTQQQKQAQEQYRTQHQGTTAPAATQEPKLPAEELAEPDATPQQPQQAGTPAGASSATQAAQQAKAAPAQPAPVASTAGAPGVPAGDPAGNDYLVRQLAPSKLKPREVWAAWKPSPWHDTLAALAPDVFKLLPQQYNTMHKNPCWGGTGAQLACLPYFNIIGVSKSGTTDLYHRLTLHKQAILPATNKGPHFWDECPYPPHGSCQAGPSGDFQAYVNLFSRAADLIRTRPDAITGEASSNTFTSANGVYLRGFRGDKPWAQWAGAAGANATMPALLREAQPYLRLILMLRNPTTRYYSAFNYYRWWLKEQQPPTPDDFHAQAVKEVQQWRDCVAASSVPDCVRRFQPQQLVKGMYAQFLPDWLRHWPRQQMLILRYEDYIKAVPQHLKAVLAFLDVPEPDPATLAAMAGADVQNRKPYAPMRADTRQLLDAFFAPFNSQLAEMLGDARWTWADDGVNASLSQPV